MNQSPNTNQPSKSQEAAGDLHIAAGPAGGQHASQAPAERIVGNFVVESDVPMPTHWERSSKSAKFPFGDLAVGQSIVIRGVNLENLDRVIDSWRKRKNIDLIRFPIFRDVMDEFRVTRRG